MSIHVETSTILELDIGHNDYKMRVRYNTSVHNNDACISHVTFESDISFFIERNRIFFSFFSTLKGLLVSKAYGHRVRDINTVGIYQALNVVKIGCDILRVVVSCDFVFCLIMQWLIWLCYSIFINASLSPSLLKFCANSLISKWSLCFIRISVIFKLRRKNYDKICGMRRLMYWYTGGNTYTSC